MSDDRPEPNDPEPTPDPRPQPRYGVYATPEEQRARIQKPDATWALQTGESVSAPTDGAAPSVASPPPMSPVAPQPAPARGRLLDRIVTFGLLAYALVNVAVGALGLLDFPAYATTFFGLLGIPGEFSNIAEGRAWGTAAAIALVVGYVVTAWFAVRRTLAGKLAWWIPLVGALVTHTVVGVLVTVPLMSDPALTAYLNSLN